MGQPIKLRPWQKRELKKIYDNPHGTRTAILSFGRKNGKTALAAMLLLLHLCGPESVQNSQLVSTATSRDQAALLFALAQKMVLMSPDLDAALLMRDTRKEIICPERGTVYTALSSDAKTKLGSSPIFAVHDELGQVVGPVSDLYDNVESGMGAHESPMSVVISTQARTDADLLSILIDDALLGSDKTVTIGLYTSSEDDDPFLVKTIKQANPAYGDFLNNKEVKKQASKAKRMPAFESSYRNLNLNQRVNASDPFVSIKVWKECGGAPLESFEGLDVYGGLDLSATTDLTSLELVAKKDGEYHVKSYFWMPKEGLVEKSENDRVPYSMWAKDGLIRTTPGSTVRYEFIAYELQRIFDTLNVRRIAFDRWNWQYLRLCLEDVGFDERTLDEKFIPFGQGYASMSPALRELETILLERKMLHGNHPVLGMCAANAVVQTDPAGNRKLAKDKSSGRIDGMVALAMAVAAETGDERDKYVTGRLIKL